MRWIIVRRAELDQKDAEIAALRRRIRHFHGVVEHAASRVRFNISKPDNAAAYCMLVGARIRDLEANGWNRP